MLVYGLDHPPSQRGSGSERKVSKVLTSAQSRKHVNDDGCDFAPSLFCLYDRSFLMELGESACILGITLVFVGRLSRILWDFSPY